MVRGNDRDLMVGFNNLQEAGVPMISTVTPANAGDAWASHKSIVDEALASLEQGNTPVELTAAAAKVEQIAAAWRGSGVTGEDGTLMADQLEALAKTLSGAADGRTYRGTEAGTVTPANSDVAWAAHQPVITHSLAILNEGGAPTELAVAAAEVARIAAAWRGSGVTAEDGGLMADHLDGLAQSLSDRVGTTQARYGQQAAFENVFREVIKREPSGDLVKDADILSRYGENAVTDMGYAGEVQAFEKVFRDVTKREPSGDLVKDADILSRYGENAVTDMGYAGDVQAFEKTFRDVTGREPSGDLAKDADILSRYGENPLTDIGYAAEVQAFEKTFRDVTGREPSGDLAKDADILSRYGESAVTDMAYAGDVQAEKGARQEKEGRVAHLEGKFRDEASQIGDAPGGFVEKVLDSQIEGGGLPTNHPDFAEYDQLRTELDGPHWRREQIARATEQLLDDSTIGTIDIGPAKDAVSALVTGRHVSNYDSSIQCRSMRG